MEIKEVTLEVPARSQLIIGQSHFIKTVEDVYEALVSSMPGAKFGVAFCESSGKALIRYDGTDKDSTQVAIDFALRLSAGHIFVVILADLYPINVLNRLKSVDEVANIYCATANSVSVIIAESEGRRGILGVMDGETPKGVESDADKQERREFLRTIGYKR
jgi:adenosine/AMP kinase